MKKSIVLIFGIIAIQGIAQDEIKKLESPFFNYKHEEVRRAMVQFMNVLSQHIEIKKDRFELLLHQAVKDTIYLVAIPQAYMEIDLDSRRVDQIREKTIEGSVKYLKIYKKEIFNFLSNMKGFTIDNVVEKLADEFDDFDTSETVLEVTKVLSEILEISPDKIYSDDPDVYDLEEGDIFNPDGEGLLDTPESPQKTAGALKQKHANVHASKKEDGTAGEKMKEEPPKPLVTQDDSEKPMVPETENPTNPSVLAEQEDEHTHEMETVNKQFKKEEETLAEHHEYQKKSLGILSLISLNHRYMFIKELFNNDKNEFENALFELEEYESFDDSVAFLVQSYAKHNEWDMQSDEVKEFLKVLFRRFR